MFPREPSELSSVVDYSTNSWYGVFTLRKLEADLNTTVMNLLVVGSGGFLGVVARYGLTLLVQRSVGPLTTFPYGTLAVNLLGCLAIGMFVGFIESRQLFGTSFRLFALVGMLGGFTTFSTFGYETLTLLRSQQLMHAIASVGIHIFLGVALVALGFWLTTPRLG